MTLEHLIASKDGAWHWSVVIEFGLLGGEVVPHGAPERHDWGLTLKTLMRAQEIARRAGC